MKIVTVIGARPQFIKAAVVARELKNYPDIKEVLVHTGQHYDKQMSDIFFTELQIPEPDYNLAIGSGFHGEQTGKMLAGIEKILITEKPNWVLTYGDTNSTLAGALAAAKLNIKIAHVEAGLRSYNMEMPEEVNRIMTDHISTLLLSPTKNACSILEKEGLGSKTVFSGDVMYDSVLYYDKMTQGSKPVAEVKDKYYLATIHRPSNTDVKENLMSIFRALNSLPHEVVIPLHPRTRKIISVMDIPSDNIIMIDPVGYKDMVMLLKGCEKVFTDSGGLQKEAFFLGKQCVTMREETEWIETLSDNWNVLAGADEAKITAGAGLKKSDLPRGDYFGYGNAGRKIIESITAT